MTVEQYIDNINKRYKQGNATEHTFRGDLQQLIESLVPEIRKTACNKVSLRRRVSATDLCVGLQDSPFYGAI